ncbi:MAG: diaminopimelate dehydrogenase [Oscillospiraceae bacterium]|nr:diaminopimelate dehydrogenase [Oscillospiraceae bacterium]
MIRAAIIGYGNIGKFVFDSIKSSKDFELVGVIRREPDNNPPKELVGIEIVKDIKKLSQKPDVAILCTPTRSVEKHAIECLSMGINTVDSYDIHSSIWDLKQSLDKCAKQSGAVSIISAGWDPGSDSVVRTLMEAATPRGITYTNFGPGMSMGHTVAVKAINGVKKALSVTIPLGTSIHRRMVYIELEAGFDYNDVSKNIKSDSYFSNDETHVIQVDNIEDYIDMGHGVNMIRKGVSGKTQNQLLEFNMKINNPALTAEILIAVARASIKQNPGAYTMIEIPVLDLLYGDREALIKKLV